MGANRSEAATACTAAAALLYLLSFLLPALTDGRSGGSFPGLWAFCGALVESFLDVRGHNLDVSLTFRPAPFLVWLANPAFWAGLVFAARGLWREVALAGVVALALGSVVGVWAWLPGARNESLPPRPPLTVIEADGTRREVGGEPAPPHSPSTPWGDPLVGYYTWVLALGLLAAAGTTGTWPGRRKPSPAH